MTVKQHYDQHLGKFYSWMLGNFDSLQQSFENFLKEQHVYPSSTRIAFDLGAGNGIQSVSLAKLGFEVKAVDFNDQLLGELATHTKGLPVEVIKGDIRQFSAIVAGVPELIICWGDTLTHLESKTEIVQFIRHTADSLPAGGKLLVSFRDYTHALTGDNRFIQVKSDGHRILTCFLEYTPDHIRVTDLLYEKNGQNWEQKVSSYQKVRITPDEVMREISSNGLTISFHDATKGLVRIIAEKDRK